MLSNLIKNFNSSFKGSTTSYLEFKSDTTMTIAPKYTNTGVTLQYSLDGISWIPIESGAITPIANIIYFRGSATETKSLYSSYATSNAWTFTGATNLECNGKLDRLLQNSLGSDDDVLIIGNYCFSYMFYNNTTLITAPELPATTLANYCYQSMFQGCTNLTVAPELPATTLATYCYIYMFRSCTKLTVAPELPATTLANGCYQSMFLGCTNLTVAPELPATTLTNGCYVSMFRSCTNLTTAPELPATKLTSNCYGSMFQSCTNLTVAPSLPATILDTYCYQYMFQGCTNLTTLPKLPATTLANGCYQYMFNVCTGLKLSTTQTDIYDTAYRIPTTGTGTTATNALISMFEGTGGTFNGTPEINTTYYTENTLI